LDTGSTTWLAAGYMLVLGLGLGMVMQVLVLAVQNATDYRHLGVATSGVTLFRSIGGSVGVSLFGAIFSANLAAKLAATMPGGVTLPAISEPTAIAVLPPPIRVIYLDAFTAALHPVFISAAAVAAAGFALSWLLREVPLQAAAGSETIGQSFAMPHDATSLEELEEIVTRLERRENHWEVYRRIARSTGVPLAPDEIWLLVRLCIAAGPLSTREAGERFAIPAARLDAIAARLVTKVMIERHPDGTLAPTSHGRDAFQRMVSARRARLAQLLERWVPEEHAEAKAMLDRLGRALIADLPAAPGTR
jgi:hypothetical protein